MATKGKTGKPKARAARSDAEAAVEGPEQSFRLKMDKNLILTVRLSIAAAPVGGKGPKPRKDELLSMLVAALTAMLVGKGPKPKKNELLFKAKALAGGLDGKRKPKALVGGPGRKDP